MRESLLNILQGGEFNVEESFEIPGKQAEFAKIPEFLFDSQVGVYLSHWSRKIQAGESGLWVHQAHALEALGRGENVVISTGTASGKSLIFRALALHKVHLNSDERIVVFYPLRALVADQLSGWRDMARKVGFEENDIGQVDGSVATKERESVMANSKIILMTPDVCHAWMMPRIGMKAIRQFVGSLSTLIIDEAHTLEGVFGSNFAFLIRRLTAARNHVLGKQVKTNSLQIVATTATIANPEDHLGKLTGAKFSVVDHEMDQAPRHERIVAHIECAENEEFAVTKDIQHRLLESGDDGTFITFVDSRKGAELLAIDSQDSGVLPYRAGYDKDDREHIERLLHAGKLQGIVSTSALELGIDIPHLRIGINVGIPQTRKAYRQRLGRVARNKPGGFVVIAPKNAFKRYGTSFEEYHEMSVEPSYLYLDNRFMQFAHGRCLADELEFLKSSPSLPTHIRWPTGFGDVYSASRPGGNRPQEFDAIAERGGDMPHLNYPLRNDGEINFQIRKGKNGFPLGEMSLTQALRECYPGATYLHMARAFEVIAWRMSSFESFIEVKPGNPSRSTRPRIRTWVNASLNLSDIINGHFRRNEKNGFLAECQMQITERVEGYVDGVSGEFRPYQDLRQRNPNMRAYLRNFRTSGIVLCIDEDWFKTKGVKRLFSDRLREVFVHEYSILPQDVDSVATNISVQTPESGGHRNGCVAVFDQTSGSLRLTERLYRNFDHILKRLLDAVKSDYDAGELPSIVERVRTELAEFSASRLVVDSNKGASDKSEKTYISDEGVSDKPEETYIRVFTPGSRVCYRRKGQASEDVEIIQPTIMYEELMYQIKVAPKLGRKPGRQWVAADSVEESGDADAWGYAWWNRETETYEAPPDE